MRLSKKIVILLVVFALLAAAAPAHAGGENEVLLGLAYGSVFGFLCGGVGLIWAGDPDEEYPYYLGIGVAAGFVLGAVYGAYVPPDVEPPPPPAPLEIDALNRSFRINALAALPALSPARDLSGLQMKANLLRIEF